MAFELKVYVDPTAALRAGKTLIGDQTLTVTDKDVEQMSEKMREMLAVAITITLGKGYQGKEDVPLAEPTMSCVFDTLAWRVRVTEQKKEEARLAAIKAQEDAARREQLAAAEKAEAGKKAATLKLALHKWIDRNGEESHKKRFKEGLLAEGEIFSLVEESVFEPLEDFARYSKMPKASICRCSCFEDVKRTYESGATLSDVQYERFTEIREAAPRGAVFEIRTHRAKCPSCSCAEVVQSGACVVIEWNGYPLTREYTLA